MADDKGDPGADPDRAAILARRQRFIAIALSSLAGSASCTKPQPHPCLNVIDPAVDEKRDDGTPPPDLGTPPPDDGSPPADDGTPPSDTAEPQPCLKVMPPPEEPTGPKPCLRVAAPKEPSPQPCLDVSPPPDDDKAPPRPCLNLRAHK